MLIPDEDDDNKLGMAAALVDSGDDDENGAAGEDEIDENLFDGEDLDLVEEELENLEIVDWYNCKNRRLPSSANNTNI